MPVFSPRTDRIVTFAVRFFCGALIGFGIWAFQNWGDILEMFAHGEWKSMLLSLLLWSGIVGLIFALTNAKNDGQFLE